MPLIYSFQQQETSLNTRNTGGSRQVAESFRRYVHDNFRPSLLRQQSGYAENDYSSINSSTGSSSDRSDTSLENSSTAEDDSDGDEEEEMISTSNNIINVNINQISDDDDDEEEEEEEHEEEDDNTTVTESFTRSRVDVYRLAIRTNSEILEDLAAIIRILRQINAIYRVFNNSTTSSRYHTRRRGSRRRPRPILLHHRFNDDDTVSDSDEEEFSLEEEDEDEEANKLLEAGLEDLQTVLTMENNGGIKRQSTLALLALITYQRSHCSENYLRHYLDPNGEYDPELSIFAAATYDEEEEYVVNQTPKSCKDIMNAAEELYGPDWLNEFHTCKEGALRKMLEKLTFVAQIRLKIRDQLNSSVIR